MLEIDEPAQESLPVTKMGRPSLYRPEFADQARKLCALGATDANLADFFEVSIATIRNWMTQHADFLDAIKEAKKVADELVERSLYMRARGYEYDDIDIRTVAVGKGISEIVITPIRRHVAPDPTSMIFWLKNRQPERWRDIKAVELSGRDGSAILIAATKEDEDI